MFLWLLRPSAKIGSLHIPVSTAAASLQAGGQHDVLRAARMPGCVFLLLWGGRASHLLHPDPSDISSICFPSRPGRSSSSLPALCVEGTGTPGLPSALFSQRVARGSQNTPLPYYYLYGRYSSCPTSPPVNCFTAITSYHYGWRTWVIILPSAGNVNHSLHPLITMSLPVVESRR